MVAVRALAPRRMRFPLVCLGWRKERGDVTEVLAIYNKRFLEFEVREGRSKMSRW